MMRPEKGDRQLEFMTPQGYLMDNQERNYRHACGSLQRMSDEP